MTSPTLEWYKEESEQNRRFYELVQATWPDKFHDWKVNALLCPVLHRVNRWFVKELGRGPKNRFEKNRRVRHELPQVRVDYGDLYTVGIRTWYCDWFRYSDDRHQAADGLPRSMGEKLPF